MKEDVSLDVLSRREAGVLLHITSLPSRFGIGDLGAGAYRFVDFLKSSGQSLWQILPLNPTSGEQFDSPYSSISSFAGNPLFISPEILAEEKLVPYKELEDAPLFPQDFVDYSRARDYKYRILNIAYNNFKGANSKDDFQKFCEDNSFWLEDFVLYSVGKNVFGGKPWNEWPAQIRDREKGSLRSFKEKYNDQIEKLKFFQYLFFRQWFSLKEYCSRKGVKVIADLPIYVSLDSADTWSHPWIFKLDSSKRPQFLAGVPPDYFSSTGQLWGNPIYDWPALEEEGFRWWVERMKHISKLCDIVRIDHFRGLVAYWQVPAGERTAIKGKWVQAPARNLLRTLFESIPHLDIIGEDLGVITPDVRRVMRDFGIPGMKVLLFAFGEDNPRHPYLPHNYERNCVVYTGTHDNNTVRGWFEKEAQESEKRRFFEYIGRRCSPEEVHWEFIRLSFMSVADKAIVPMQDILGLDDKARMNKPSTTGNNWKWRLRESFLSQEARDKLFSLSCIYGRCKDIQS